MNTDPQIPSNPGNPRADSPSDGQARPAGAATDGPGAPAFPTTALRDWLNHRVKLGVPVWAVVIATLVLIVVALD